MQAESNHSATGPAHSRQDGVYSGTMSADEYTLTTEQFATRHGIKAQSLRARLSRTGHYFGVRPLRLANGRTLWPDVIVRA
jgi:hypothetical protein